MEKAIDTMEGIAEDGGETKSDNIAREARVRSAYLEWCKEFGKKQDEERFKVFSENFLTMEKFSKETGKEMTLNQYADFTEEEYKAATEAEAKKEEEAKNAAEEAKKKAEEENAAKAREEAAKIKAAKEKKDMELQKKRDEAASK